MSRRSTPTMRNSRFIAPAGEFAPEVCADPSQLLCELLEARSRSMERQASTATDLHEIEVLFNMRVAADPVDEDGLPVNEFEHLTGEVQRQEDGYQSWLGPMPVASLVRVLADRIDWHPPETRVAQSVLEGFAAARVQGLDHTVAALLDGAIARSRSAQPSEWDIRGMSMRSRGRMWSVDRMIETPRGEAAVASKTHARTPAPDEASAFEGLYARTRSQVHDIIFGAREPAPRPQILPRQPGLVLSVAYTIEFLTFWDRESDLVADNLVDAGRAEWYRFAVLAGRTMDGELLLNAVEQTCRRTSETFPEIRRLLRAWSGIASDEAEATDEDDKE